jgi:hypothetical protein
MGRSARVLYTTEHIFNWFDVEFYYRDLFYISMAIEEKRQEKRGHQEKRGQVLPFAFS